jgi:hypothetical protein
MNDDKTAFSAAVVMTCLFLAGLMLVVGIIAKIYGS